MRLHSWEREGKTDCAGLNPDVLKWKELCGAAKNRGGTGEMTCRNRQWGSSQRGAPQREPRGEMGRRIGENKTQRGEGMQGSGQGGAYRAPPLLRKWLHQPPPLVPAAADRSQV